MDRPTPQNDDVRAGAMADHRAEAQSETGGQSAGTMPQRSSSYGWRQMLGKIAATNDRAHIEQTLRTYVDTWATGDVEGRLALFADDVVVEDPATVRQATGKAQLRELLHTGLPSDWNLVFSFERVAVVADEAILTYRIVLHIGDAAPAVLLVNAHAEFGPDGLIHRYRTFFDTEAITERPMT